MNALSTGAVDEVVECPLCMEPLEVDDLNFFPCTCGYQICRFCWHRIRTDENELCPACRKEYPENPADFKPLTQEEMIAFKSQKRQRDQQRKQKITENRKHLANVRVVQKNLVFVVGLPPRLANADILKKHEYFGKYGKIHKVVINPSTTYAGIQGPSASAYVTYIHNTDALRAIQSVNNITIDGRLIKTSLGTTKYCSHFMKNQQCPKTDCMYLHELGDPEASFTKEEMHQGKHQEYEKRLHEVLIATSGTNLNVTSALSNTSSVNGNSVNPNVKYTMESSNRSNGTVSALPALLSSSNSSSNVAFSNSSTSTTSSTNGTNIQQKEAWPSLSVSPTTATKDTSSSAPININVGNSTKSGNKKDRLKTDKIKNDKTNNKVKNKSNNKDNDNIGSLSISSSSSSNNSGENQTSNDIPVQKNKTGKSNNNTVATTQQIVTTQHNTAIQKETKAEESEQKSMSYISNVRQSKEADDGKIEDIESNHFATKNMNFENVPHSHTEEKVDDRNSLSSSSSGRNSNCNDTSITTDESNSGNSGKSTPGDEFNEKQSGINSNPNVLQDNLINIISRKDDSASIVVSTQSLLDSNSFPENVTKMLSETNKENEQTNSFLVGSAQISKNSSDESMVLKSDFALGDLTKLSLFDGNSFFSSVGVLQDSFLLKNKLSDSEISFSGATQINNTTTPHLPDLINDLSNSSEFGRHNNSNTQQQQQHLQNQLLHQQQQNSNENNPQSTLFGVNMSKFFDFHKNQQQQKMQNSFNNPGANVNGTSLALCDNLHMLSLLENNRITNSQLLDSNYLSTPIQQQQLQKQRYYGKIDQMLCQQKHQQTPHTQLQGSLHPNTAQTGNPLQKHFLTNTNCDDDLGFDPFVETQKALAELMENEIEQKNASVTSSTSTSTKLLEHHQQQPQQTKPSFNNSQQTVDYMQRARMPPPGFNHMNAFEFGIPRTQNNSANNTSSKIMPFINLNTNSSGNTNSNAVQQSQLQQQQQQLPSNSWNSPINGNGGFSQQQQHMNDAHFRSKGTTQMQSNSIQKGYIGNDWTAMDPAILSFRQFSTYPQHNATIAPHLQQHRQQQQDLFMQQMAHQQNSGYTGFNGQTQLLGNGNGLSNSVINPPQALQPHVNANVQGMLEYLKNRQFV